MHDGNRLPVCRTMSGWADLHAEDTNARFEEMVGSHEQGLTIKASARRAARTDGRSLITRVAKG